MKKKEMVLTVLALLSVVVITVGVTFAFFNYTKERILVQMQMEHIHTMERRLQ